MKKRVFFGLLAILLAFGLILAGCDNGMDNDISRVTTGKTVYRSWVYNGSTPNGTRVTITITKPNGAAVTTPTTGDLYEIKEGTSVVSRGTIAVSGSTMTFTPGSNSPGSNRTPFTATISGNSISNLTVPGTSISNFSAPVTGSFTTVTEQPIDTDNWLPGPGPGGPTDPGLCSCNGESDSENCTCEDGCDCEEA